MYKFILQQLVLVLALLLKHYNCAILFVQAFVNFAILAQYAAYNNTTIKYIKAALYKINKTKNVFFFTS